MKGVARIDGARIRQARLKARMTQLQLAREINTSERNIARWENGPNQPRVSSVAAIADATGQSIDFFLRPDGSEDDDEESDSMTLDAYLRLRVRQILREESQP